VQTSTFSHFDHSEAVQIVREAGALALSLRGRYSPTVKADQTLVTEADQRLEEFLREKLGALAPGFSFLGEEGGLTGDPDAPCWVIDPIDGTTNFVRGIPLWCVSVGAVWRGQAIWGAIAIAPQNEIMWGGQGLGAWLEPLSSTQESAPQALHAHDSDALMQEDLIGVNTTAERAVDFRRVPCRLRNLGTLAYHTAAVSRGMLCASLAREYKLYDIAAGIAIGNQAGCVAKYLGGEEWRAEVVAPKEPRPLIVAPPKIMQQLLDDLELAD
jgi:fructose-1,6-bisphosphatase/inositol monophosphatase family enzyme